MKRYKLLKDLPFAKAGEELYIKRHEDGGYFTLYKDINKMSVCDLHEDYIEDFSEWFEEAVEEFYYIDEKGFVTTLPKNYIHADIHLRQAIGNYFKTKEEAEEYLEYLKAKEVIRQDAKGFKPDWLDRDQVKYSGNWNLLTSTVGYVWELMYKGSEIYFKSEEDINESIKKHPDEWRTYLTYEQ